MKRLIVLLPDGVQQILELADTASLAVDADTHEPIFPVLWDSSVDGDLPAGSEARLGGLVRIGDTLQFDAGEQARLTALRAAAAAAQAQAAIAAALERFGGDLFVSSLVGTITKLVNQTRAANGLPALTPEGVRAEFTAQFTARLGAP